MVRHGTQKKRRAGRVVSRKDKTKHRDRKVFNAIKDLEVKKHFNSSISPHDNLQSFGLIADPNSDTKQKNKKKPVHALTGFADMTPVLNSDRNPIRRLQSEVDQKYVSKLYRLHGDNSKAVERDIKTNDRQLSSTQYTKMLKVFLSLPESQRFEPVPTSSG
jgi:Ribosome biogenesis protein Nop16